MALQASAPGELRGALGRLGYLCVGGAKAMFVAAQSCSLLPVPPGHDAGMLLTCTSLRLKAAIRKKISVPALAREQEEKGPGMVPAPKLQGPQPNVRNK